MFGPELKSSSRRTPHLLKRLANRVNKHFAKGRTHSGALSSLQDGNRACPVPCWERHHLAGVALNTVVRKVIATLGRRFRTLYGVHLVPWVFSASRSPTASFTSAGLAKSCSPTAASGQARFAPSTIPINAEEKPLTVCFVSLRQQILTLQAKCVAFFAVEKTIS